MGVGKRNWQFGRCSSMWEESQMNTTTTTTPEIPQAKMP